MAAACCGMVPRATATGSVAPGRGPIHAAAPPAPAAAAHVTARRLHHPDGAPACCRPITRTQLLLVAAAAGAGARAGWSVGGQLWSAFQGACQTVAAIALLFAALPPLLSTQYGTRALCAAASRAFPGDVRVQSLSAGWLSPVNLEGLEMREGRGEGGRRLLAIGRLTTAEPLYQVLFGGNVTLTIAEPALDMTLDDSGTELRLAQHFKAARLSHILAPPGGSPAAAQGDGAAATAAAPAGAAGPPADAAAAAADAGGAPAPAASDDAAPSPPEAEPAATEAGPPERSATETALADAIERGVSALRQRLTHADASAGFSLEVRSDSGERRVAVFASGGQLLVPREIREAVGRHLHGTVALGAAEVRALAEEMGDDAGWAAAGVTGGVTGSVTSKDAKPALAGGGADTGKPRDQWFAGDGADGGGGAAAETGGGGSGRRPVAIQLDSERVMVDARGWSTAQGLQLQRPLHARVDLTPDFASMTLASFNPLLHDVLSVRDGGRVALSYGPAGGRFGAGGGGTLRVEPVRLAVAEGRVLGPLLRLLNAGGLFGLGGAAWGGLPFLGGGGPRQLEVWTGPMEVELRPGGVCNTRRVDMLLGNRVRLCVWGTVDTCKDAIDMRIGIPASTLASTLKIRGLPPDYMLPLELRGSTLAPVLDINAAARKVAVISAMQLGRAVSAAAAAAGGGGKGGAAAAPALSAAAPAVLPLVHLGGAVAAASAQFLQQCAAVDGRLQTELGCAAPPAVEAAPWDAAAAGGGGGAAAGGGGSSSGGPAASGSGSG